MSSTQIEEFKSKEACERCGEHKLFTNNTQKGAPFTRYRCVNCNHEFIETAEDKARKKKPPVSRNESYLGMLFVVITMFVIVAITTSNQERQDEDVIVEPTSRIESVSSQSS